MMAYGWQFQMNGMHRHGAAFRTPVGTVPWTSDAMENVADRLE